MIRFYQYSLFSKHLGRYILQNRCMTLLIEFYQILERHFLNLLKWIRNTDGILKSKKKTITKHVIKFRGCYDLGLYMTDGNLYSVERQGSIRVATHIWYQNSLTFPLLFPWLLSIFPWPIKYTKIGHLRISMIIYLNNHLCAYLNMFQISNFCENRKFRIKCVEKYDASAEGASRICLDMLNWSPQPLMKYRFS